METKNLYGIGSEKGALIEVGVTVKTQFCWNRQLMEEVCHACESVCPVDAIEFDEAGLPEVKELSCTYCGLCTRSCKTGALVQTRLYSDRFLKRLIDLGIELRDDEEGLTLTCPGLEPAQEKFVCLSALEPSHYTLLAASGLKKLAIRLDACENCQLSLGKMLLMKSLETAMAMTESLGMSVAIEKISEGQEEIVEYTYINLLAPQEVDRRQFLKLAIAKGMDRLEQNEKEIIDFDRLEKQSLILSLVKRFDGFKRAPQQPESLPFKNLLVTEACKLCGDCQVFCPGKAIQQDETRERSALIFEPVNCLGCDLCEMMCTENALESLPLKATDFPLRSEVLFRREKSTCQMCEKPFVQKTEESVCPACVKHKSLDEEIMAYF